MKSRKLRLKSRILFLKSRVLCLESCDLVHACVALLLLLKLAAPLEALLVAAFLVLAPLLLAAVLALHRLAAHPAAELLGLLAAADDLGPRPVERLTVLLGRLVLAQLAEGGRRLGGGLRGLLRRNRRVLRRDQLRVLRRGRLLRDGRLRGNRRRLDALDARRKPREAMLELQGRRSVVFAQL